MERSQLLLQEMGISQWQLVRPKCLKGIINLPVEEHIRLIIISETENLPLPLLKDVLLSLGIMDTQYLTIDFNFFPYLKITHPVHYWILSNHQEKINHILSFCHQALSQWQSPYLADFMHNPQAKRQLWEQIQGKK